MNETFLKLPKEKQQRIINAAMEVFSQNEYKRASTDDIAAKAGISKGSLFYYFQNKKQLYLYLYEYTVNMLREQILDQRFWEITDFFELLSYAAVEKLRILRRNPYISDFAMRCFYSKGEPVTQGLDDLNGTYMQTAWMEYFKNIDLSKFKEEADPVKVFQMLVWMADGYIHQQQYMGLAITLDNLEAEFNQWKEMLKPLVYKEEYLNECD